MPQTFGENYDQTPQETVLLIALPEASFTRPADTTAYASGDLVANSTTAASVAMMQFGVVRRDGKPVQVRAARIRKSGTSTTNAQFRLHLYARTVLPANGDNGAWSTPGAAVYCGAIDVTLDKAFTDGAQGRGVPAAGSEITFRGSLSGMVIFGLLEARAAYTPDSAEVFTVTLEAVQG